MYSIKYNKDDAVKKIFLERKKSKIARNSSAVSQ